MEEYFLSYELGHSPSPDFCKGKPCYVQKECIDCPYVNLTGECNLPENMSPLPCDGDCYNPKCPHMTFSADCTVDLGKLSSEEKEDISRLYHNMSFMPNERLTIHSKKETKNNLVHVKALLEFDKLNATEEWGEATGFGPPKYFLRMQECLADIKILHSMRAVNRETPSNPNGHDLIADKDAQLTVAEREEEWITCKDAAKIDKLEVKTLKEYRSRKESIRSEDKRSGKDFDGRVWKKADKSNHILYLKSSLKNAKK